MRSYLKKLGIAGVAALSVAAAAVATSSPADARRGGFHGHGGGFHGGGFRHGGFHRAGFHHGGFRGHWGGRGFGFAPFAGALAFGAVASSPYWYSTPVAYYDDCFPRRRIVGYTPWGQPIVRIVRTCYY